MAWLTLFVAGLLEIVWAIALKRNAGFSRPVPSIIGVTSAVASFLMLASALKTLPVGTAYAVWVGIGAVGVAIAGILIEGESVSALRILFLGLIVAGVIGLKVVRV